ncbi:MAG: RNA polymerase sigma factor [Bacilli bacterium]
MRNIKQAALYEQYERAVYFYALSLTHNHELAQDLTQDTFLKALLGNEHNNHPNMKAWLLRVCRNAWIDHCRRNKHLTFDDAALEQVPAQQSTLPLEHLLQSERNRALYQAMQTLPQHIRECFVMHYFSDVPQHEIAAIIGLSHGAVRTLFYRGRLLLKKQLEGERND